MGRARPLPSESDASSPDTRSRPAAHGTWRQFLRVCATPPWRLPADCSRSTVSSPGSLSEPAVGEYGNGGPGLTHHVKIKVGQQQAGLCTQ
jgi:hypothetical protein